MKFSEVHCGSVNVTPKGTERNGTELKRTEANARVAFHGKRFRVPSWLHEDLTRALGAKAETFDLVAWYPQLDAELEASGEPVAPSEKSFLMARMFKASGVALPNLFGRQDAGRRDNIPDAQESARRRELRRAGVRL